MWESILQFFRDFFKNLSTPQQKKPTITRPKTRNERVLALASQEMGVKEVAGTASNPRIVKYHAYAREDNDLSKGLADSVPWCASFVAFCLESVGMGSTNSMLARSYLKWGVSVKASPLPGDIIVFWRGTPTGWQGHVGFYVGQTATHYLVLGGNQSNAVNVAMYGRNRMLDIRRSSKHAPITMEIRENLTRIAATIRQHRKSDVFGNMI